MEKFISDPDAHSHTQPKNAVMWLQKQINHSFRRDVLGVMHLLRDEKQRKRPGHVFKAPHVVCAGMR